jgi:hypothetical protein
MRISNIKLHNLDNTKYRFEIKGEIRLYVDDYELARDWLDDDLYNKMIESLEALIADSIVTNKNPYYDHKVPFARERNQIKAVLSQLVFQELTLSKVVEKCVNKTKLPEEEVIKILKDIRPDFNFESDWKNRI